MKIYVVQLKEFLIIAYTKKVLVKLSDTVALMDIINSQNDAVLKTNVAAVLDKEELSQIDIDVLNKHARKTSSGYCAGCANICNAAIPEAPYISHIIRCLMYYNSYAVHDRAKELFSQIPEHVRRKLSKLDYRNAETHCPQRIPVGGFVLEAVRKLA